MATTAEKPLNPETRLARMMLPEIDPHSPLLPTNKWIFSTLKTMIKTHDGIRGRIKRAGALALGALGAVAGGIAGAVLAPGLLIAGAAVAAGIGAAGVCGFFAQRQLMKIKTDHMKDVQEIVKNKYLEMKAEEFARTWSERAEKARAEREAKRAQETARKAQEAAAAAEIARQQEEARQKADANAPAEPTSAKSVLKTFGRWAALKAREGAHTLEDKLHDALEEKAKSAKPPAQDVPARNGDTTPDHTSRAVRKNGGPKNGG